MPNSQRKSADGNFNGSTKLPRGVYPVELMDGCCGGAEEGAIWHIKFGRSHDRRETGLSIAWGAISKSVALQADLSVPDLLPSAHQM